MLKRSLIFGLLLYSWLGLAQVDELPVDFRQHNLNEINSSLLNPVFSLDRTQARSLAFWTRWQWQTVDGDPTTLLFNYTHRFNRNSAGGGGFFQHNTGFFQQTGGVLNYAYNFDLGRGSEIALGLNTFAYQRKPADDRFQNDPNFPLPQFDVPNEFILQMAPGIRFKYDSFSVGLVGENFIDYNVSANEQLSSGSEKIILGLMSYRFPVYIFGSSQESYIEPTVYLKTLPNVEDQVGISSLFSTPLFWAQLGYNSFYGVAGGIGGRFFKNFSVGALVEFGSKNSIDGSDTSIEFLTAYNFGDGDIRRKIVGFEEEEEAPAVVAAEEKDEVVEEIAAAEGKRQEEALMEEQRKRDSVIAAREEVAIAAAQKEEQISRRERKQRERDSVLLAARQEQLRQQKLLDSIASARREAAIAEAERLEQQRKQDSLAQVAALEKEAAEKAAAQEKVVPAKGEKYEESTTEDGLAPGYYLIANVFGTKKYFDAFMKTLSERGLQPKSFYRDVNKYNYVYLDRYTTIDEARRARDSKYNGRYTDNLWIFRVVGN